MGASVNPDEIVSDGERDEFAARVLIDGPSGETGLDQDSDANGGAPIISASFSRLKYGLFR